MSDKYLMLEYLPGDGSRDPKAVIYRDLDKEGVVKCLCEVTNKHNLDLNNEDDVEYLYGIVDVYLLSNEHQDLMEIATSGIVKECNWCGEEYPFGDNVCPGCGDHGYKYKTHIN